MNLPEMDAPGRTVAHPGESPRNLEAAGIEPAPKTVVSGSPPGRWLSGEDGSAAPVTATALPAARVAQLRAALAEIMLAAALAVGDIARANPQWNTEGDAKASELRLRAACEAAREALA